MESSTLCEPSGTHDCEDLHRQGMQTSKHITGQGGDAEARVLSANDDTQYFKQPPAGSAPTPITEQAVECALLSQSVQKAPGPDKLSFGAIWPLGKRDKHWIVRLTNAAICT
jgi:hypothetical protein